MPGLHELIDAEFGVRTREGENRENTAMSTTSQRILRQDSSRLAVSIFNLGSAAVFIRPNQAPSSTVGFRIGPNGGGIALIWNEDFTMVGKEWFGLTGSGTSTIYVLEILEEPAGREGFGEGLGLT